MTRLCPALFATLFMAYVIPSMYGQTVIEDCLIPSYFEQLPLLPIPDAQNDSLGDFICWEDSLTIDNVDSSLTWEDLDPSEQMLGINIEHEWLGDLTITYTCPNGQSVTTTNCCGLSLPLGEPAWEEGVIGIGYDYYWSDQSDLGNWNSSNEWPSLPSDTYNSDEPLTALDGCPIAGVWTIDVCDTWGFYGGYIFDWGVPYAQLEPGSTCLSQLSMSSASASSYCTSDGEMSYSVDSIFDLDMTITLTQGGTVLDSGPLLLEQSFTGLQHGLYTVTIGNSEQEFSQQIILVEDSIFPNYNAGADPICSASLDAELGWNRVIWQKEDASYIASFDVYRESNVTSEFEWIGNVHVDSLSTFVDVGFDPGASSTRYDLVAVDSCGGEIDFAGAHRTIHLQSNLGVNGEVNLFWNPYEGFNYDNFSIHRSTDGEIYFPIGTVANNVYAFTDQFPPAGNKWYQIRIPLDNACEPVRSRSSGFIGSNINALSISGIEDLHHDRIQLTFEAGQWQIMWTGLEGGAVELMDMMGRQVWKGELPGSEGTLPFPSLASGAYLVHVTSAGLLEATRRITY